MKHLKDLDTAELLEAEAHTTAQLAKCDYGSNIYRKWDKQLDRILAEMYRRSEPAKSEPPPPFAGALGLAGALLLCAFCWSLSGCAGRVEAVLPDDSAGCYVEPSETRCEHLPRSEPMYCHAPQTRPFAEYCESAALDTGTNVGSQWCCANAKINGRQP